MIIASHMLEHVYDPVATCQQLRELLTPEGMLYVDVPNAAEYESLESLHVAHAYHFTIFSLGNVTRRAALDTRFIEPHRPPHHPPSIRALLRRAESAQATVVTNESGAANAVRRVGRRAWLYDVKQRARRSWPASVVRAVLQRFREPDKEIPTAAPRDDGMTRSGTDV